VTARNSWFWFAVLVAIATLVTRMGTVSAQSNDGEGEIVLAPGEQKTLPGEGVDSFSAASNAIIEVRVASAPGGDQQIIIVGKTPGTTSLVITLTNGRRLIYKVTVSKVVARHNVQLDVYFVQMSRSRATQIGLAWPGSVGATATGTYTADTGGTRLGTFSVSSTVLPRLDFAAENGWAKVLDHAKVVMSNGDEGTYSSGGDFNIRVTSGVATSLERITFGSTIKARVSYDASTGRVSVHLTADISRLVQDRGADTPGLSRTAVDTSVNMALGESLALGGLYSSQERSAMSGLAILSEIPVLGYLFGGKSATREQIENVVFIVPTLVSPVSIADRDRVTEALRVFSGYDGGPIGGGVKRLRSDEPVIPTERRK
jgi:Flp pilus assembly secretin CpaC